MTNTLRLSQAWTAQAPGLQIMMPASSQASYLEANKYLCTLSSQSVCQGWAKEARNKVVNTFPKMKQ